MVSFSRATTINDLEQILELQQLNTFDKVPFEEREVEGFVTVKHDLSILQRMNEACPHIIAKKDRKVIGYALCMHPKFGDEIEVLRPMFHQIEKLLIAEPFIVMGQICIAKEFRKKGIFRRLYKEMLSAIHAEFHQIITEVDITNTRSLQAHLSIGFEELGQYRTGGQRWSLISLKQ